MTSLKIGFKQVILEFSIYIFFGKVLDREIFMTLRRHSEVLLVQILGIG
jgi:hypothetical protein